MSGHWSTSLELADPQAQGADAARPLVALLRETYGLDAEFDPSSLPPSGIGGEIVLGSTQVWLEVVTATTPSESTVPRVALMLDSSAYELAYDTVNQRSIPHGLEALVDFCVDIAEVAGAAGFRLQFGHSMSPHFDLDTLVRAMKQPGPSVGLIVGLKEALPHWQLVRGYWPRWRKFRAYQVTEFIS